MQGLVPTLLLAALVAAPACRAADEVPADAESAESTDAADTAAAAAKSFPATRRPSRESADAADTAAAADTEQRAANAAPRPREPAARRAPVEARRPPPHDAMDRIVLERTEVTGNRELPKVLYIVPWHKSAPGELPGKPVNTLLDEVLAPLDRDEFIRQVDYYSDVYGKPDGS